MPTTQSQRSKLGEMVRNLLEFRKLRREQHEAVGRLEAYERSPRLENRFGLDQNQLITDLRGLLARLNRLEELEKRPVHGFRGIGRLLNRLPPSEEKLKDFRQSLKDFSHRLYQVCVNPLTRGVDIAEACKSAGIPGNKFTVLREEQRQAEKRLIEEQQRQRPWADETPGLTQRFFERELSGCMNRIKRLDDLGAPPANGFAFFEPRADELWALKDRLLTLSSDLSLTAEAVSVNMNEVRQNIGINQIPNEAVPGYTGPSLEYLIYNQVRPPEYNQVRLPDYSGVRPPDYSEGSRAGEQPTAAEETVSRLRSSVHGSVESDINRSLRA
jgi:hypothetical protein